MSKSDCIYIFNAMLRGDPVSFNDKLLPLVSDYLTDINYENSEKIIYLITQNPQLIQQTIPTLVDHFCRKYTIFSLQLIPDQNAANFGPKTILYYE